jgi:hypothetical protein
LAEVTAMLNPFNAEKMNAYPIGAEIKSVRNKGLSLLEPIGERIFPEIDMNLTQETRLQGMGRRKW